MKALVIAVALFLFICVFTMFNYFILDSLYDYTEEILWQLKSEDFEKNKTEAVFKIEKIEKGFKDSPAKYLIKKNEIRELEAQLTFAKSYLLSDNYAEFISHINFAQKLLEYMRCDSSVSIKDIL